MGIVTCIAFDCKNRRLPGSAWTFHTFPLLNKLICRKWEVATKLENFVARKDDVLCSAHFSPDSYLYAGSKKLKDDAVPSLFSFPATSSHGKYIKLERKEPRKREFRTEENKCFEEPNGKTPASHRFWAVTDATRKYPFRWTFTARHRHTCSYGRPTLNPGYESSNRQIPYNEIVKVWTGIYAKHEEKRFREKAAAEQVDSVQRIVMHMLCLLILWICLCTYLIHGTFSRRTALSFKFSCAGFSKLLYLQGKSNYYKPLFWIFGHNFFLCFLCLW